VFFINVSNILSGKKLPIDEFCGVREKANHNPIVSFEYMISLEETSIFIAQFKM